MLFRDDVIRIRKFLFVWMMNASAYLIKCNWHEFQGFCGNNNLWVYDHVDASCVITSLKQGNFCFMVIDSVYLIKEIPWLDKPSFTWISRFFLNQQCHLWTYDHLDVYCGLKFSEYGHFAFFSYFSFHKLLLTWNSKFSVRNHKWAYNEVDAYCVMTHQNREVCLCLNVDCLYLKLLLLITLMFITYWRYGSIQKVPSSWKGGGGSLKTKWKWTRGAGRMEGVVKPVCTFALWKKLSEFSKSK